MSLRQKLANFIRRIPVLMLIPYYTYRFFMPKYTIGVVGVVMNPEGKILLVEHVFHPRLPWGIPGGWINFNEDPADAVVREIFEELDLRVEVEKLLLLERTEFNHINISYFCRPQGEIGKLSYELLNYEWIAFEDLPRLHKFHYKSAKAAQALWEKEA